MVGDLLCVTKKVSHFEEKYIMHIIVPITIQQFKEIFEVLFFFFFKFFVSAILLYLVMYKLFPRLRRKMTWWKTYFFQTLKVLHFEDE